MYLIRLVGLLFYFTGMVFTHSSCAQNDQEAVREESGKWQASWIASPEVKDTVNEWVVYTKEFKLAVRPKDGAIARIAVDSKYWLWVNEQLVIKDGQLKRGPTPSGTYYDTIDISNHLRTGKNIIAILSQYFGKDGFSHRSSGRNALLFELRLPAQRVLSDSTWSAWKHPSFGYSGPPHPNFRLPESNTCFDARKGGLSFVSLSDNIEDKPKAVIVGNANRQPWGKLVSRPIPQWKDFGLRAYDSLPPMPFTSSGDTIIVPLPYNAQVSPYFEIEAAGGEKIDIRTDHYFGGGPPNVRTIYIAKPGRQTFEELGWMNGHHVKYYFPEGIKIVDLKYRESGYDTEFAGNFNSNDDFYNQLWQKALRTLYVTMRDTYMDCPDRERAQWWGDVVLESGEAFYALDRKADLLTRKGILELMNWQRPDGTIFSPVPAGNWDKELPTQMLASVGYYGFWNYYLHSGDLETMAEVYDPVKKYLQVWKLNNKGVVTVREGGWTWGDWGENKDITLLMNGWYYLALKGMANMAFALDKGNDADSLRLLMDQFKRSYNENFWNGEAYRSADYKGKTDDRSQALAVVSGLAGPSKFGKIFEVFKEQRHASPYMEKYVLEALFMMEQPEFALQRMKERFYKMVTHPTITTLWEGWGIGKEGYGGGTINHAWSGGGLTLLSQYVAGIEPVAPGYEVVNMRPQLGELTHVACSVPSVKGDISIEIEKNTGNITYSIRIPDQTVARVYLDDNYSQWSLNNNSLTKKELIRENGQLRIDLPGGNYVLHGAE